MLNQSQFSQTICVGSTGLILRKTKLSMPIGNSRVYATAEDRVYVKSK